jgi:DNA helicase II / ATP-dependent DNA helicase PcrA
MLSSEELLEGLTAPQREAVAHRDGPLLIIAAAGSGKTRVLTRRVAHLISEGAKPNSILAITFTNKAAGEMKERVANVLERRIYDFGKLDQPSPMVCTFHSLCLRILKHYATLVGLAPNFLIYDSSDQNKVVKDALKALEISSTNFQPSAVHSKISTAKNQLITAEEFAKQAGDFFDRQVARVYLKYQEMLNKASALDFDDLLLRTVFAMRDHPQMLAELQERFRYILIDEYQDTNRAQYLLTHALAAKHGNICVVGDPDQSIYAWRGADLRNILDFENDYAGRVKVIKLEQNYRSSKTILQIAGKLIAQNLQRKDKELWTENAQGEPAKMINCQDEHDEAEQVVQRFKELHELKDEHGHPRYDWGKMAIFYRMNSLSRVVEDALRKNAIPYQIARGTEFYNRKEIKDTLAYLRVIANPRDEVSLDRIANTPTRGISDATLKQLSAWGIANGGGLWDAMQRVAENKDLNARAQAAVTKFVEQITAWQMAGGQAFTAASSADEMFADVPAPAVTSAGVQKLLERVVRESGLEAMYRKIDKDAEEQVANINELISSAAEFDAGNPEGTLSEYLAGIALVADADHMEGAGGAVTMMTLHAAKGLEFPVVAMVGLEEGILPHSRSRGNIDELEEERRLCFVGITRAQEHLILSKAARRTMRGISERSIPSPFIAEMPQESLDVIDRTGLEFPLPGRDLVSSYVNPAKAGVSKFKPGTLVRHPSFGVGKIFDVSDIGQQTRAVVDFSRAGRKTLILEYARLEVVS